jgi:hypothetical protein
VYMVFLTRKADKAAPTTGRPVCPEWAFDVRGCLAADGCMPVVAR